MKALERQIIPLKSSMFYIDILGNLQPFIET